MQTIASLKQKAEPELKKLRSPFENAKHRKKGRVVHIHYVWGIVEKVVYT